MYQLTAVPGIILRTTDGYFVPVAEGNADYLAYLAWVEEGNEAEPAPAPEPDEASVPRSVTPSQAREALIDAGLLEQVEAAINAIPGVEGLKARNKWEHATSVDRDWPLLAQVSEALGLSDADLDALFAAAGKL
ncbi:hypothetical protein [Xylophilus sp. GOD-11R]|uniref:hypothetical protein n=1 Tax=Xylophilus sp. GOD-11R TaxID=3089814 RepID=UPI00298C6B45|nr:hypothetical protein [Xylophilus sp. GOD-11R]WPB58652.1 hypothetical protein R9X41_08450 [Xylophilus sp. GOD-11R]